MYVCILSLNACFAISYEIEDSRVKIHEIEDAAERLCMNVNIICLYAVMLILEANMRNNTHAVRNFETTQRQA